MKKLYNILLSLCLAILIQGCSIKEDLSACGMDLVFKYDYNMEYTDLFATEVDNVSVYVFDSFTGEFVSEHHALTSSLVNNNTLRLMLEPGTYDFVVWGDLSSSDFNIPTFVPAMTTLNDFQLSFICNPSREVSSCPTKLFHGILRDVVCERMNNPQQVVSLIKDTNTVNVTVTGIPVENPSALTPEPQFSCRIISSNGEYLYDNKMAAVSSPITYIPSYLVGNNSFSGQHRVLRLMGDHSCRTRLVITHNDQNGEVKDLFDENLTVMLMAYPGMDLDRQDVFDIKLEFDYTHGTVTIVINGWVYKEDEVVLG